MLGALLLDVVSCPTDVLLCYASVIVIINLTESLAHTIIVDAG
jgi:hypothetical protein